MVNDPVTGLESSEENDYSLAQITLFGVAIFLCVGFMYSRYNKEGKYVAIDDAEGKSSKYYNSC